MILNGTFTNLFWDLGCIPSLVVYSFGFQVDSCPPEGSTLLSFGWATFRIFWDGGFPTFGLEETTKQFLGTFFFIIIQMVVLLFS